MGKFRAWLLLCLTGIFLSCGSDSGHKSEKLPNGDIIEGFGVSDDKILYQFYEKFGFTDVCTTNRAYFKADSFQIDEGWKSLPISARDLSIINSIPNKVDSLGQDSLLIIYPYKDFFLDISLDSEEFIDNSLLEISIKLNVGYYRLNSSGFDVFNSKTHMMYHERHECEE
jgi:hypothetical protein